MSIVEYSSLDLTLAIVFMHGEEDAIIDSNYPMHPLYIHSYVSIHLLIHLSMYLSMYPSIYRLSYPSSTRPSIYSSIHQTMYPSMYQPFDFYKQAVENLPIVCVDVICKRSDGKVLLFYRRDKPVAHLWWW